MSSTGIDRVFERRLSALVHAGEPQILQGGRKGVEKESLRVLPHGRLALTPHPPLFGSALTNEHITTDYSEALIELVTPPFTHSWELLQYLLDLHQFVYRHSGGLFGSRIIAGSQALLLTTTGRRSGEPRTCALIYLKDGERLVVVASNGGSDHPPSWLLNLQAHPHVRVQIGLNKFSARASVASAEERKRLWPRVNRHNMGLAPIMHPGARGRYDLYQRHTTREIPLVLLKRNAGES